jgi:hypothetical protein
LLAGSFSFFSRGFRGLRVVGCGVTVTAVWLVPRPDFVADAGAFPPPSFRESAPPEVSTAMDLFDCWGLFGVGEGDGAASVSESTGGDESSGEELFAPAPFPPPAARRTSAGDAMLLDLICGRSQ